MGGCVLAGTVIEIRTHTTPSQPPPCDKGEGHEVRSIHSKCALDTLPFTKEEGLVWHVVLPVPFRAVVGFAEHLFLRVTLWHAVTHVTHNTSPRGYRYARMPDAPGAPSDR